MKKMIIAMIAACCFALFSAGAAFAEDPMLEKQKEIDRYVFEQHSEDLADKGISVTHTAPQDGYVEIGITPYNETNAEYLYGIFGKDAVKVVEGEQAVTFAGGASNAAPAAEPSTEPLAQSAAAPAQSESSKSSTAALIAAAVAVLAAVGIVAGKRRMARK